MALSINEKTRQEAMDYLSKHAGFPIGYCNYKFLYIDYLYNRVECTLNCYFSEDYKKANPDKCYHYIVGFPCEIDTTKDVRDSIYPALEEELIRLGGEKE
ncbi:MAG: hypothetical protein ACXQTR_01730 [Candidatus Methanospirareceae archaeon]